MREFTVATTYWVVNEILCVRFLMSQDLEKAPKFCEHEEWCDSLGAQVHKGNSARAQ
jgi:hypothetical protein